MTDPQPTKTPPAPKPADATRLTMEEKAALTTGAGVPGIRLSDGPHGLRLQNEDRADHLGINGSAPATCFPPAVTLAGSWDAALADRVGRALGRESRAQGVHVLLGPGVNIKRSPLCGRNFEYFSEDPLLSWSPTPTPSAPRTGAWWTGPQRTAPTWPASGCCRWSRRPGTATSTIINGPHLRAEHAVAAIDSASDGTVEEGNVGGGTGMNCYGFKGGSGTASRVVRHGSDAYTVGAFVQANFGDRRELVVCGVPVGRELLDDNPMEDDTGWVAPGGSGSVIVVVGTDAPLLPGQCKALARRVPLGLGRTGTNGGHFSGDIFLAFSTANEGALTSTFPPSEPDSQPYDTMRFVPWNRIDPFYEAVVQAVEEAVLNALITAEEMTGRDGHRSPALPLDRLRAILSPCLPWVMH